VPFVGGLSGLLEFPASLVEQLLSSSRVPIRHRVPLGSGYTCDDVQKARVMRPGNAQLRGDLLEVVPQPKIDRWKK